MHAGAVDGQSRTAHEAECDHRERESRRPGGSGTPDDYEALDARGLGFAALTLLCGEHLDLAGQSFAQAREVTKDPGTVRATLRLFDALAQADGGSVLVGLRTTIEIEPQPGFDRA